MRSNQRDLWDVGLETPVVEGSASVPCLRIRSESSVPSLFFLFIFLCSFFNCDNSYVLFVSRNHTILFTRIC